MMLWSTGQARTARARTIVLAIAVLALLVAWVPGSASAAGCTDTWTNTAGGSWFTAANWSTKAVPTAADEACITTAGTYTVEMSQTSAVSLKALTIGGASGTQTLAVGSTSSAHAVLSTTAGITNGVHGAITLTNGDASGNNVTINGPITNAGQISSELAHGGARTLAGAITNTGTIAINTSTSFNGASALLKNEGTISLATGTQLVASNSSTVANLSGGKIVATGTGDVLIEPSSTFNEGAGTTSGAKPVIVRDSAVSYTGAGASLISVHGESSTLSGNVSAGQTLVIESTNGENAKEVAATGFSSAGTITLTNAETSGNSATLAISAGVLSSSGTINVEKANGGARSLQGSITNTGTLTINTNTNYNGKAAALVNQGALTLATAVQLTVSNEAAVTNAGGGSVAAAGSGEVLIEPASTFNEGAGTTSGTKPVIVRDAALVYSGSGSSLITIHGEGSTLSGNISAGQTLVIESTNGENAKATAAASFSSAGTITLTNAETSANNAALFITTGTLSSSGAIKVEFVNGGARTIQGNVTNTGTVAINQSTSYNAGKALFTNSGALTLAAGKALVVSAEGSFLNGTGGSIAAAEAAEVQIEPGSTFTEGTGTTSGPKPVIVRDASLAYTGAGASLITIHGEGSTLSGNISAGQTLVIESINGEHAKATAATSFSNAGTITLTNSETSANNAGLFITSGALSNSGTINSEKAIGGVRTIQGNLTNTGTLAINTNTSFPAEKTLTNAGVINIATAVALSVSGKSTVSNETGGMIAATGTGALVESDGTFNEGLGKTTTTKTSEPVILIRSALNYTDKGASKIAQRGTSSLTGTINKGQTLTLASYCSEHTQESAAGSFTNSGTINLTNAETCPNNVTLKLAGGTLLNKGTINVLFPHGGTRSIEGSLLNEKTLAIANGAGQVLGLTGSYTATSKATSTFTIAGSTNYAKLSAGGAVTIGGKLVLKQVKFTAKAGETFAIIGGASRTGEFAIVKGNEIKKTTLHYVPVYTATGVNLQVE